MEPGYIVCGLPMIAFLLDWVLSLSWSSLYFRYGLPLLWQTWPLRTTKTLAECMPLLERDYQYDMRPIIEFRAIGPEAWAFQEKVLAPRGGLSYLHIMHGYLSVETDHQQLVLIGFAKWYVVVGLVLLLSTLLVTIANGMAGIFSGSRVNDFLTLIPVMVVVAICYGIQAWRYYHVGKSAAELMAQAK